MKPKVQFRLRISKGDDIAVGPGQDRAAGSDRRDGLDHGGGACTGMSYRRAGCFVDMMNRCFGTESSKRDGGKRVAERN
jgi:hypothetical protein